MTLENRFLESLDADDRRAVEALLRPADVAVGQILIEQGDVVDQIHFPLDAQLANVTLLEDGSAIETSVVGREGVSGLAPFLARTPCTWRVAVRARGRVLVAAASDLRRLFEERPGLRERLLKLTYFYQSQSNQTAACNVAHRVRARVARWLLTADDFTPGQDLTFTQEEMAALLGAQRTSVVEAFSQLKRAGALSHLRGRSRIADRARMEAEACACYAALKRLSLDLGLLPESGT